MEIADYKMCAVGGWQGSPVQCKIDVKMSINSWWHTMGKLMGEEEKWWNVPLLSLK